MNDGRFSQLPFPNTMGKPIYREYEGKMLISIIEAANEINATGKFPIYAKPYKNIENTLDESYKESEQNQIKIFEDDVKMWKKEHKAESNFLDCNK